MTTSYVVVIPAYNAAATIGEAIDSILGQSVPPEAVVVVDDGSTDETAALAAASSGKVTVIRQINQGPGAATTAGLKTVDTPFFATLDADDIWLPGKAERQLAVLRDDPGLAAVFTLGRLFRDGSQPDPAGDGRVTRLWTRTTMFFRTGAAQEVGDLVDPPGRLGELVDWLARSREIGHRHVMLEEILAMRRIRPGSLSSNLDAERSRGYLLAAHNALERRRQRARQSGSGQDS
jgi:glycosyltransferase involved in cell wall biosynthesis